MTKCELGRKKSEKIENNHIIFGNDVGGLENPVTFPFDILPVSPFSFPKINVSI